MNLNQKSSYLISNDLKKNYYFIKSNNFNLNELKNINSFLILYYLYYFPKKLYSFIIQKYLHYFYVCIILKQLFQRIIIKIKNIKYPFNK